MWEGERAEGDGQTETAVGCMINLRRQTESGVKGQRGRLQLDCIDTWGGGISG